MPKDTLAREQEIVVQAARSALTRTIEQYSPIGTDTLPITTVAISRMFADLINNVSSAADIVDIIKPPYRANWLSANRDSAALTTCPASVRRQRSHLTVAV